MKSLNDLQKIIGLFITISFLSFYGCGGGGGGVGSGTLNLSITDAPVDGASAVVVTFTGVEIQPANGNRLDFDFATPQMINLMQLTQGVSTTLLNGEVLPAGQYSWIRLKVDIANSYITINGADLPLRIPSAAKTGLKLNRGFNIATNGISNFTVDFDLRKSVHLPEGVDSDYILRPTLRIIDDLEVGSISGHVDASLLSANTGCYDNTGAVKAVLYIFTGAGVTPDDVDGVAPDPISSAIVDQNLDYMAAFLPEGDYTVSLTCEAEKDDPVKDDVLVFIKSADVPVVAKQDSLADFAL